MPQGFLQLRMPQPTPETPQAAAIGASEAGQQAMTAEYARRLARANAAKSGVFTDSGDLQQFQDAQKNAALDQITTGNDQASDRISAGLLARAPSGPTSDIGLGGGPIAQPDQQPLRTPLRTPLASAMARNMGNATQSGVTPSVGNATETGTAGMPEAVKRPMPGELMTDPGKLQGGPPRIATVADARAHDQAMASIQQASQAPRPPAGLLAPSGGASGPTDAFGIPTVSNYLAQSGIPGVVRLSHGGGGVVPSMELAPEAYRAEAASAALGNRLRYQAGARDEQIDRRGVIQGNIVDRRYSDQLNNGLAMLGPKEQQWSQEQNQRYGDQLDLAGTREGWKKEDMAAATRFHVAASEAVRRFGGTNPTPQQRQATVHTALANLLTESGGDPDKAAGFYNTSPDARTLAGYGLTEDKVRGAAQTFQQKGDMAAALSLANSGSAEVPTGQTPGQAAHTLRAQTSGGSTSGAGTAAPTDLIGAETDINTRARAAAKANPSNATAIESRRQQLITEARKNYKGGAFGASKTIGAGAAAQ
jgi:hypothetical protein